MNRSRTSALLVLAVLAIATPATATPAAAGLTRGGAGTGAPAPGVATGGSSTCAAAEQTFASTRGFPVGVCPSVGDVAGTPTHAAPTQFAHLTSGTCNAEVEKCEKWVSTPYDGPANGEEWVGDISWVNGNAVATTSDGSVVFTAGMSQVETHVWDMVTLAYDATTGARLWVDRYPSSPDYNEVHVESVVANQRAVYVTGFTFNPDERGLGFTRAYDATTGSLLWHADFPGWANHSAMSDDGSRLFVIGDDALEDGTAFARLVAYDSQTGEPVWDRTLADPKGRHLLPWRIDTAGDRVSYAAGRLKSVGPDADRTTSIVVATYDATGEGEGDLISSVAAPTYGALPAGIALNRDGSMAYVTQAADEPISRENVAYTVAFDTAAADVDWTRYLEGWTTAGGATSRTFPWYFHPIEVSPRGSVVLTTYADPTNGYSGGYVTFSMDPATGGTQWIQREGVTDGAYYGSGPTLSVNPVTGQVVVTGPIIVDGRLKVLTWSLSPEGAQEWISVSNELPNNAAVPVGESTSGVWPAVVHSPDGRHVFVAGNVWAAVVDPSSSPDIVVAAFDTAA